MKNYQKLIRDIGTQRLSGLVKNLCSYVLMSLFLFVMSLCPYVPMSLYAAFNDLSPGVRPAALGGAFTALSDDACAIFYNPAGLYRISENEFMASYGRLHFGLDDNSSISDTTISYINPLGKYGTVGMGIYSLSLAGLYSEKMILFSYGIRVIPKLGVGLTAKSLSHTFGSDDYTDNAIDNTGASTGSADPVFDEGKEKSKLSFDFGIFYRPASRYNLGFVIQNINSPDIGLKAPDRVEKAYRVGFAYSPKAANMSLEIISSADDTNFTAAFEKHFTEKLLILRGALTFGSRDLRKLNFGLGVKQKKYKIDYAFIMPLTGISDTFGTHKMSISFLFGPVPKIEPHPAEFPPEDEFEEKLRKDVEEPPVKIITDEDRRAANLLMKSVQDAYRKGMYSRATDNIRRAMELNPEHQGAVMLDKKTRPVASIIPEKTGMEKISRITRKGITAYLENNAVLALNAIRYATELAPDDLALQQIFELVAKEFPDVASLEKSIPGLTLVSKKLQQALENIYAGKYVQAIAECNTVLELEEDNVVALQRLGSAYWAIGNFEKAKTIWKEALKYDPDNEQILEFLSEKTSVPKVEKFGEEPPIRKYIVQKGDTPQKISLKFYGSKTSWGKIYEANKDRLRNRWSLVIGQELIIP